MTTYPIYLVLFFCWACTSTSTQPMSSAYADSVRIEEAQTPITDTENELYFSDALIYEYQNSEGEKGECWIYINPETGRVLFTKEAWEASEEMTNFIIANPDGSYLQFYTDAEGKDSKKVMRHSLANIQLTKNKSNKVFNSDLEQNPVQLNQESTIANLKSQAYERSYLKMNGKEILWLAQVPFNTHLLYGFSKLDIEAKLPIYLDYSDLLQNNQLVTQVESSSYAYQNGEKKEYKTSFRLISFEPATYYVPYKQFTYYEKEGDSWIKKPIPITLNPQEE